MDSETFKKNGESVIWAMGGKRTRTLAHAYLSEEDYQKCQALCGRPVKPHLRYEHWMLDDKDVLEHTCPYCLERVKFIHLLLKEEKK